MPRHSMLTFEEYFWSKVDKTETCWNWTGTIRKSAKRQLKDCYGSVHPKGRPHIFAHRMAWELVNGPIPEKLFVLHRCDNRKCVRPDHLFLGTHQDNMADRNAKGRGWKPKGEKHPSVKIDENTVRIIRERYDSKKRNGGQLSRELGVPFAIIHQVQRGITWKHVK